MIDESEIPPPKVAVASVRRFDMKSMKVLIADDNQKALDILVQVLLGFGVRDAVQCLSIAEAIPILDRSLFDLIIADSEMPARDGFDLTSYLRANPSGHNYTIPIVLMTACPHRAKIEQVRDAGANMVIAKPIVPGVLLGHIETLAKFPRQFVSSPNYNGPDRRFHKVPLPSGIAERRADDLKLLAQPEREMSQDEIDSIFS